MEGAPQPTVVTPEGEVDIATVGPFRVALADAARQSERGVLVDLSRVTFIDSTGLGALVDLHHRLRREMRRLAVIAPAGSAAAVLLDLTGLKGQLPLFATREAALEPESSGRAG